VPLKAQSVNKDIIHIASNMASWIAGAARKLKGAKRERHVCSICNASFSDKNELEIHTGREHQGRGAA
jgi:hypothetical protein